MQIGQVQSLGWREGQPQLALGKPAKRPHHPGQGSWGPVPAILLHMLITVTTRMAGPKKEGQPNGSGLGLVELSTQVKDRPKKVSVSPNGG